MKELCYKEDVLDLFYTAAINQDKNFIKTVEMVIEETPTVYAWHDLRKNPDDLPEVEREVEVACLADSGITTYTHGLYENGKVRESKSKWYWCELYMYGIYCEDIDEYLIPEGWWEWSHYNPERYSNIIDDKIIAWREIEPFEREE